MPHIHTLKCTHVRYYEAGKWQALYLNLPVHCCQFVKHDKKKGTQRKKERTCPPSEKQKTPFANIKYRNISVTNKGTTKTPFANIIHIGTLLSTIKALHTHVDLNVKHSLLFSMILDLKLTTL